MVFDSLRIPPRSKWREGGLSLGDYDLPSRRLEGGKERRQHPGLLWKLRNIQHKTSFISSEIIMPIIFCQAAG